MTGIVSQLARWVEDNAQMLQEKGTWFEPNVPEPGSEFPWQAGIGFKHDGILAVYRVWERTILQTELEVFCTERHRIIEYKESEPSDPRVVSSDLDDVVTKLLDHTYKEMEPDPKWKSNWASDR